MTDARADGPPAAPRSRRARFEAEGEAAPAAGDDAARRLGKLRQQLIACDWRDLDLLVAAAELCLQVGQKEEGRSMLVRVLRSDRNHERARALLTGIASAYEIAELGVQEPSHVFRGDSKDLFAYPFRGNGWVAILSGAILFGGFPFAYQAFSGGGIALPFLLVLISMIFLAAIYMLLFLRDVIYSAATGSREAPEWPEPALWALFGNAFRAAALGSVAWLPAILVGKVLSALDAPLAASLAMVAFLCLGMYFFPMMFLYNIMTRNLLDAFRLPMIIRSIRAAGPGYRRAAIFWELAGLSVAGMAIISVVGYGVLLGPAFVAMAMYLFLVAGRSLGLVCQAHREKLGWF